MAYHDNILAFRLGAKTFPFVSCLGMEKGDILSLNHLEVD